MIYALCRKIDFVENLRVFGVKILTEISIRVKNLTFSMSVMVMMMLMVMVVMLRAPLLPQPLTPALSWDL